MNTAYCPNAYWMRGAMPSTEAMRDEYIGSVYGAAALGLITTMATLDALDMMEERTPQLIKGRLKHYVADITGRTGSPGHAERVTRAINAMLRHRQDTAWMADFGNAANEAVAPQLMRFRNVPTLTSAQPWCSPRASPTRRRHTWSGARRNSPAQP